MKSIVNFVMKNKLAVWILTFIITAAGLYSGSRMNLETIPDITIPIVSVTTVYPGATPEQVAKDLSEPLEKAVSGLSGVSSVSSTSYQNASSLQIEFDYGTDMEKAEGEVEDALANVTLPDGTMDPDIGRISINAFPILAISVSDDDSNLEELTKKVTDSLVPRIEAIDGVSNAAISGQQIEEISLTFDHEKMASLNLDEETVKMIVKGSDVTMPLGLFQFSDEEQSVVVDGNITTVEDLKNVLIPVMPAAIPGQDGMDSGGEQSAELPTVTLGEIAKIELVGKAESISRTNGKEAIAIQVVKSQQANTVEVANAVKEQMEQFKKENNGVAISTTMDQAEPIEDSVETMFSKALFGALFAVLIIMLFLRNFRSTIISIVSIPMSLLIAIIFLNQMDITLNMMTLGAMTVAIGRVIDDSIVVVENIYRRMNLTTEKLKGKALVREATLQMFKPITSSTLVTVAVFLPIALVGGMVGELFMPFALTIVFALLASLLVAVTIVPMLAHSLFKKQIYSNGNSRKEQKGKMAAIYEKILNWTLNHKLVTSLISVALLVGSLFLIPVIGVSFLPDEEQKMMYITYTPEPGETLSTVNEEVEKGEKYLLNLDKVETVQLSVGGENPMSPGASNGALMFVTFDSDTEEFTKVTEDTIKELEGLSTKGEWKSQDFGMGGSSNAISYYVYGKSLTDIEPVILDIENVLSRQEDLKDVKTSLARTYKEYTLVANQEMLTQFGLTTAQIGMELNPMKQREVLTKITNGNDSIDVFIDVEEKEHKTIDDLLKETVQSPFGMEVPISEFVEVKEGTSSDTVSRRNGKVFASVTATLTAKDVAKVSGDIQKDIDELSVPENVEINTAGVTEDIAEAFTQLGLAMLAAIAIVYLILVITFGGALAPFAVLFSLPFTVIGALVGLLIAGETISVSSMIGILMLIGIVVTNAIVLIDRVINMEKEGLSTREAILEAGTTRLRPILMTALATIGALIPLAVGAEGSGLISKGLGVTVIGGLTSSTLLTLIFVPIVYEFLGKFRKKKVEVETE
ncbi:efflux RND transporter permease subunit [Sporosarcina sp. Marseille-Q4063]|uniref:efflux RND transporter permease subunit n=1 Tax=Sporosarcina sp. Marseille-Q4063 TaxID=2810514 RepID=UPI001BB0C7A9|nr:efflux RND transporter permease subunit [Sporosarcina sp. Marseille-Q4063]QUW22781.1 efflux RND transporter permease subunit [Sporosarcina sp. Marseille-Q4063]